jgi:hypothetical protein
VSVAPGTKVTIGGQQHVAVQIGVRQFTIDKRYAVRFLTHVSNEGPGDFVFATVNTQHSNDPLPNQNATIDGLPAHIEVQDGRSYSITTELDPQTFEPTNVLEVTGTALAIVTIKAGDTLIVLTGALSQTDQNATLGQNEYRGTGVATYGKYTDPLTLIGQASGLDKWVDYIRVIPLN